MIRIPQNKIAVNSKIYQVYSTLEQENERSPSAAEIAKELDMSVSKVKNSMKNSGKSIELDAPFKEGESSNLYNVIASNTLDKPDKEVKHRTRTHTAEREIGKAIIVEILP
jgi:RNA polymerase primary sigma factor